MPNKILAIDLTVRHMVATMAPSLGGFVIHGNNVATLANCLHSLQTVCDHVVAVDSQSDDGSAELCARSGVEHIVMPWQGYGAARAKAMHALQRFDYIFFLDADEWLTAADLQAVQQWRLNKPKLPCYTLKRHDWLVAGSQRFWLRSQRRKRLIQRQAALWRADMIVHEALPRMPSAPSGACIEHVLCDDLSQLGATLQRYALLWAIRFSQQRPSYWLQAALAPGKQWLALAKAGFNGALWRGGKPARQAIWQLSAYHHLKYRYHWALQQGACPELLQAYQQQDYQQLFAMLQGALEQLEGLVPPLQPT